MTELEMVQQNCRELFTRVTKLEVEATNNFNSLQNQVNALVKRLNKADENARIEEMAQKRVQEILGSREPK